MSILTEKLAVVLHRSTVECVKHSMACSVCCTCTPAYQDTHVPWLLQLTPLLHLMQQMDLAGHNRSIPKPTSNGVHALLISLLPAVLSRSHTHALLIGLLTPELHASGVTAESISEACKVHTCMPVHPCHNPRTDHRMLAGRSCHPQYERRADHSSQAR